MNGVRVFAANLVGIGVFVLVFILLGIIALVGPRRNRFPDDRDNTDF